MTMPSPHNAGVCANYMGAEVNKESSLGKTALIEAVKARSEDIKIVEFLMKAGALVSYKTQKHQKSALDWAKLMKRPALVRILELADIVQRQTAIIFRAINVGDVATIKRMIEPGDFFDPNVEYNSYEEMKRVGTQMDKGTNLC